MRVNDFGNRLGNLVRALANRLTAADNFGPEGKKFQVLTSQGDRDTDPPPKYMDLRDILDGITIPPGEPGDGQGIPGPTGPQGPPGPAGWMPTYVAPDETFTVPENRQGLWAVTIEVDGTFVIDGTLVMVD